MDLVARGNTVDSRAVVPVLGAGVSGRAAADLLRRVGASPILFDEKGGPGVRTSFEPVLGQWKQGVISPGFSPDHPWRKAAGASGVELIAEVEMAASLWPGKLICITGTNGKTTLTQFLEKALLNSGEQARSCGNVGVPLSSLVGEREPMEWAVCETSSFQLHDWRKPRPDYVFWTNFAEDHLDWHPSLADYFRAKWKLVESGAPIFADGSLRETAGQFGLSIPENVRWISARRETAGEGLFASHPFSKLYRLAEAFWTETGRDPEILRLASRSFEPLPHRLEELGTIGGLRFVNDSKATNFHAALAACETVHSPIFWVGGGLAKGGDLESFAKSLAKRIAVAQVFGSVAPELGKLLENEGIPVEVQESLERAFDAAVKGSKGKGTLLLSPGFASFDQFSGYADRGEQFRVLFKALQRDSKPPDF